MTPGPHCCGPATPTPADLAAIEAVPLDARGLPESTYALLVRAATPGPTAPRSASSPTPPAGGNRCTARSPSCSPTSTARQPAAPARRPPRRRGGPDVTQLRRAGHRDARRAAGRDRRPTERRPVPAAPRAAAAPLRRPGAGHRRPRARAGDLGDRAAARRRGHARRDPRAATHRGRGAAGSRCPPSTAFAWATSPSWPPAWTRPRSPATRRVRPIWPALFHTGGTTGAPKLAAHTHANEVADAWMLAANSLFDQRPAVFAALPLFHVNALVVTLLAPLFKGQRVVWAGPARLPRPRAVRRVLEDRRALPDRDDERGAHRVRRPGAAPGRRRHQQPALRHGRRLTAARSGPRRLPGPHRRDPGRGLRADRGDLRQRPQLPRRAAARLGRAAAALPARESGAGGRRRHLGGPAGRRDRPAGDQRPDRLPRLRRRPRRTRPPARRPRQAGRRLAGHRRPRRRRRRRLRLTSPAAPRT